MSWSLDARIPLQIMTPAELAEVSAGAARDSRTLTLLLPRSWQGTTALSGPVEYFEAEGPRHAALCACCTGRPAVSMALDRLFQARVRGSCAWFDSVLAVATDAAMRAEIADALATDPLTSARFRAA